MLSLAAHDYKIVLSSNWVIHRKKVKYLFVHNLMQSWGGSWHDFGGERVTTRQKRVFGVHIWLVSSGREAQLVPKGIGQLLMEALGMSAAAEPRPWEKDGPVDRVTRFAKPRPTRKTFRDVEQAPSFHREPASLIERRNECCESAFAFQQRTSVFVRRGWRLRKRYENVVRGGRALCVCQSITLCNGQRWKVESRTRIFDR